MSVSKWAYEPDKCDGDFCPGDCDNCGKAEEDEDVERGLSIPAADVQPVVRCKDCKYGTRLVTDFAGNEYIECCHGNVSHRLDWFCADGAKEETE